MMHLLICAHVAWVSRLAAVPKSIRPPEQQIMDWASAWKAVCIAWQQGPVQQIVQCLQHADSDGLTEGAQDLFSNAMSL